MVEMLLINNIGIKERIYYILVKNNTYYQIINSFLKINKYIKAIYLYQETEPAVLIFIICIIIIIKFNILMLFNDYSYINNIILNIYIIIYNKI